MRVFVAGATGVLGRELVPQLVAPGHEVAGMTRTESKQNLVRSLGARPSIRPHGWAVQTEADPLDLDLPVSMRAVLAVILHLEQAVLASALGAKPPRRVPRWPARVAAGEIATVMMTEMRGAPNAKAKRELDWQLRYPSWRQGFAQGLG